MGTSISSPLRRTLARNCVTFGIENKYPQSCRGLTLGGCSLRWCCYRNCEPGDDIHKTKINVSTRDSFLRVLRCKEPGKCRRVQLEMIPQHAAQRTTRACSEAIQPLIGFCMVSRNDSVEALEILVTFLG
jgi:hypothetical protein